MDKKIFNLKSLIGKNVGNYTILRYINSGSFGDVFEARHNKTNRIVALKIPVCTSEKNGQESVIHEYKIYKILSNPEKGVANMKLINYNDQKIIVMDLLGESLEQLLSKYKKFGLKTIICLAIKMLKTMRYIHSHGFIHRDIKPDNFVIGNTNKQDLYCIDYGLAKRFMIDDIHISPKNIHKFCGTARYASISAHESQEQSRKDDLESIGYLLIYLYKGKLPWQGIKHKDKKIKYKLIGECKKKIDIDDLCSGMPKEFVIYLKYIRNLEFDERPHYTALIKMFENLYNSRNYNNNLLEWEIKK